MDKLTTEEKSTNHETWKHIHQVHQYLHKLQVEIGKRALEHDLSKLTQPEVSVFTKYTPKLAATTYGSEEYQAFLTEMKPTLDHHYQNNRHHPEHFKNGVDDMNLIDVLEMLCDWLAATSRQNDGDIMKSIEVGVERFGLSPQLTNLLKNTITLLLN
jgi:hypothetical protein